MYIKNNNPGHLEKSSSGVFKGHLNENKHAVSLENKRGHYNENKTYTSENILSDWNDARWDTYVILLLYQLTRAEEDKLAQTNLGSCDVQVQKQNKKKAVAHLCAMW